MNAPDGRRHAAAYARRMNKVLDHVDAHLGDPLELSVLAEAAHFSPFHFHRVFSAWMGETLGDYLRRRRLDTAALKLAADARASVLEVAVAVGFGSGEAFARAFRQRFGCTPTAWREQTPQRRLDELATARRRRAHRNPDQAHGNPDQVAGGGSTDDGGFIDPETFMDVKIITLPPVRIAYLRHIGPYGQPVARFWLDNVRPWMVAAGLTERPRYGIGRDDPHVTEPGRCRYDAGVEVPDDFVAQGAVGVDVFPGGRYAVAPFEGDTDDIELAYVKLLRDWLPASGFQADGRPAFEYYPVGARYDAGAGTFECQLCVPIRAA